MPILQRSKLLFQRRLITAGTTALYQPASSTMRTFVKTIFICNTSGADTTFSLWLNPVNNTASDQNALYRSAPIKANATQVIQTYKEEAFTLEGSSATLLAAAGAANALTITCFGEEVEEN